MQQELLQPFGFVFTCVIGEASEGMRYLRIKAPKFMHVFSYYAEFVFLRFLLLSQIPFSEVGIVLLNGLTVLHYFDIWNLL